MGIPGLEYGGGLPHHQRRHREIERGRNRASGPEFLQGAEWLSEPQKACLDVMARCGACPHRTGDIARALGKSSQQMGPTRESLIASGMIYSPRYGYAAFTVPLFDAFMKRVHA